MPLATEAFAHEDKHNWYRKALCCVFLACCVLLCVCVLLTPCLLMHCSSNASCCAAGTIICSTLIFVLYMVDTGMRTCTSFHLILSPAAPLGLPVWQWACPLVSLAPSSLRRYPPGHGDLYYSLHRSGVLEHLINVGKE